MSLNKKVFGITGLVSSGKSLFARYLEEAIEAKYIDVDKYGHKSYEKSKEKITNTFGKDTLNNNGEIDRKKLGKIVFADKLKLKQLEDILHPVMRKMIEKDVHNCKNHVIIDAALLYRMRLNNLCDTVIYVHAPDNLIKKWAKDFRGIDESDISNIILRQKDVKETMKRADIVIRNVFAKEKLKEEAERIKKSLPYV